VKKSFDTNGGSSLYNNLAHVPLRDERLFFSNFHFASLIDGRRVKTIRTETQQETSESNNRRFPDCNQHEDGWMYRVVTQVLLNSLPVIICIIWHHFRRNRRYPSFHFFHFVPGYFGSLVVVRLLLITALPAKTFFWRGSSSLRPFFGAGVLGFMSALQNMEQVGTSHRGAYYARFCGRSLCFWLFQLGAFNGHLSTTSLNYPLVYGSH